MYLYNSIHLNFLKEPEKRNSLYKQSQVIYIYMNMIIRVSGRPTNRDESVQPDVSGCRLSRLPGWSVGRLNRRFPSWPAQVAVSR